MPSIATRRRHRGRHDRVSAPFSDVQKLVEQIAQARVAMRLDDGDGGPLNA